MKRPLPIILAAGLALLLAEALLRHHYYSKTYRYYETSEVYWEDQNSLLLYLPHRHYFWSLKPGVQLSIAETIAGYGPHPETNRARDYAWRIRVNPKGFRGPDFPAEKPDGELRIVCFGDSRTLGEGLEAPDTCPGRLQIELARDHPSVRVINAGADGWSSHQGLALLERQVVDYAPDIAVFCFGINDADTFWGITDMEKARAFDTPRVSVQRALYRSMLFYWAQRQFLRARGWLFGKTPVRGPVTSSARGVRRVSPEQYRRNLRRIAAICRSNRILLVFLVLPVNPYFNWSFWASDRLLHEEPRQAALVERAEALIEADSTGAAIALLQGWLRENHGVYAPLYALGSAYQKRGDLEAAYSAYTAALDLTVFAEYTRAAAQVAREQDVPLVDLTDELLRPGSEPAFIDDMHPGKAGAKRIARALADSIRGYLGRP